MVLMCRSDEGRTSLGVIFGRRTSPGTKAKTVLSFDGVGRDQTQEIHYKAWAREYNVFLR